MKLCPYCGKNLTEQALACKHCGEWLEDISDYLKKKGSVYADQDSITIIPGNSNHSKSNHAQSKNVKCVFCEFPVILNESDLKEKSFICPECMKKNILTKSHINDVLRNIPAGWGWLLLSAYFAVAIYKYLATLEDFLQMFITFVASISLMLFIYFSLRTYVLKKRYIKKKSFGNIYNASILSGSVSILSVVLFIFILHYIYPYSGFQSDKNPTDRQIAYYQSKIKNLTDKQKEIIEIISKPETDKKKISDNFSLLDSYIKLNNEEKSYNDSIYIALGESNYYSGINENKRKIKEANLLINKITAYKNMSAQNLKHYYSSGNMNAYNVVQELNSEISKLSQEYSVKFQDLFFEE